MAGYSALFEPKNWFWVVGGDTSKAWSSADCSYVASYDVDRTTYIASELELNDVLRPYGLTLPSPTQQDYAAAVQSHIDDVARARQYSDGVSLASYKDSTNPSWSGEATAFIGWRDSVWTSAYSTFAAVEGGAPQPTIPGLIASLPQISWP